MLSSCFPQNFATVVHDIKFLDNLQVKFMTPNAWISAISDISSVVNMIDIIPGSAPGNGSRASVGEDLAAMTNYRLQESNVMTRDGTNGTKRTRCPSSDMPLNVVSSAGSTDDSFKQFTSSEISDLVSDAMSRIKRPRTEVLIFCLVYSIYL